MIEKNLKNGTVEAEVLITVTMTSLYKVWTEKPIVLYELHQKCLNKDHKLFGMSGETLKDLSLINSDGSIHNSIKNIVLSAMTGECLNLALTNPIAH